MSRDEYLSRRDSMRNFLSGETQIKGKSRSMRLKGCALKKIENFDPKRFQDVTNQDKTRKDSCGSQEKAYFCYNLVSILDFFI